MTGTKCSTHRGRVLSAPRKSAQRTAEECSAHRGRVLNPPRRSAQPTVAKCSNSNLNQGSLVQGASAATTLAEQAGDDSAECAGRQAVVSAAGGWLSGKVFINKRIWRQDGALAGGLLIKPLINFKKARWRPSGDSTSSRTKARGDLGPRAR